MLSKIPTHVCIPWPALIVTLYAKLHQAFPYLTKLQRWSKT